MEARLEEFWRLWKEALCSCRKQIDPQPPDPEGDRSAGKKNETPGLEEDSWRLERWYVEKHITKADIQMEPDMLILKESLLTILFFLETLGLCSLARRNQQGRGIARIWKGCFNFGFLWGMGTRRSYVLRGLDV